MIRPVYIFFPMGFLQLAGGTNAHTVDGLKKEGLFQTTSVPSISLSCSFHISFCSHLALYHFPILIISFFRERKDETLMPNSPCLAQALIGGVAYVGYAHKVSLQVS